ncbi:MAG: hypothetical protein JWM40_7 [Frankiales bacterium]|nr:hypothetical protein [Frankiales bacterium]
MHLTWSDRDLPCEVPARLVTPTEVLAAALAREASHPDAVLPAADEHFVTWLAGRGAREREVGILSSLPGPSALDLAAPWSLTLLLTVEGSPVGVQRLVSGDPWPERRVVYTSGWLLRRWQRQGLGKAARRAVLDFAFGDCGAEGARSHVLLENTPSRRISEGLGYRPVGEKAFHEDGRDLVEVVYEITAAEWLRPPASDA